MGYVCHWIIQGQEKLIKKLRFSLVCYSIFNISFTHINKSGDETQIFSREGDRIDGGVKF